METSELKKTIETLLFMTDQPLSVSRMSKLLETKDLSAVQDCVLQIQSDYSRSDSAVQVLEIGGGFQMATRPQYSQWVRKLYHERMVARLSSASLETLAIIAYKQPITRAEIELVRGVEVIAPLETLMERGLIAALGRKETVGRPILYGTTAEFLKLFGLKTIEDLPKLETFEKPPDASDTAQEQSAAEVAQEAACAPEPQKDNG
ncbi:MAG: SMC-Scp complex subunit ScpB [Elusimicrobia bacterium]|nr:SMC-Scp complex subunit ScpB [Elusimicrobiota bacterium]